MSFLGKTFGKIVSGSQTKSTNSIQNEPFQKVNFSHDTQLTLTHLRKVFYEYQHPKNEQSSPKDDKLYQILPLFIKAFSQSSLSDINDKFGDVGDFCFACSRLLVNEISKRVHDDLVLVKFFEIKTSDDATDGAGLLSTVNLLASGPPFLIEIMTKCLLPSRLVMCVYLFICLSEPKDSILDHCEFNAKERRILFQKSFQQLLIKLCQISCTCDELVDGDSLKLLFKIISSTCEQHNVAWRQTATDALLTLTKNFNTKSINYVHANECVQQCLLCLDPGEICSSNLIERTNLLITLLTFIRETSSLSQILLDDFRLNSGYKIIVDIILRLEKEYTKEECRHVLKNLFFTLEEFVSAGSIELKPNSTNVNMFKIEGFQVPQPQGKGRTVRNIYAFQCLLHIFNRVQSYELGVFVLETIRNIYVKDECNYFILESQNLLFYSLDDSSMKVHLKNNDIQVKFIEILEFIIFGLKFVPCKELVSIGLSIQNYNFTKWSTNCANFLLKLIKTSPIYKDAFRELGLLEMLVSCMQKFAALLKEKSVDNPDLSHIDQQQKDLGFLIMNILTSLISQNSENSKLFRQIGGARVAHNMVPYKLCRTQALNIVSTLLLTTAGEDDMSTLLGLMHTAKMEDLELKNSVLKSLLNTLRESHRTRTVFRKSGGFVYVVSVLISMEGSLSIPARPPWDTVKRQEIFSILKTILKTLTVSMRYEPANAKFFETEVRWKSLCAALRLLGCFEADNKQFKAKSKDEQNFIKRSFDVFETYFCTLDETCFQNVDSAENTPQLSPNSNLDHLDQKLIYICYIMRLLYDTAIDSFDSEEFLVDFSETFDVRPFNRQANRQSSESHIKHPDPKAQMTSSTIIKRSNSFLKNLTNPIDEPFIIHPGAVSSILNLLPSVPTSSHQMANRLQYNMINLIKNLLKFERNQQIMSNMSFIDDLLFTCKHVLNDENHFLNASIQHIFERLASQCINSKNLKEYLRLGTLFDLEECQNPEESVLVPLSRVKCLISMTSPRDNRLHQGVSFVEFNMLVEGFGCLFLPSISPQLSTTPSIVAMGMVSVGNDLSVNGGVGTGERVFPPQSGLSYSTWIYIEKFPSNSKTPHPIRILTLIKHFKIKDTLSSCLTIYLSPKNRSLFINTEETLLQQFKFDEKVNDYSTKFNCSELFQEGQWLHLCIVLNRAVLKNSSVSLYVNSNLIGTQRLNYINSTIMPNTTPSSLSIHGVIGTLPIFRSLSPVTWRQASCYLFEDIISPQSVQCIFNMGPNYLGSFQSLEMENFNNSLIMEDRIMFGIHPSKIFEMTLAKFRGVYNKNDSKSIGKQLNIPSNENVTPLRILSNTAAQLQGPSRTVGGVVIGYMGVRVFQPMPVSKSIENIGGVGFLLALISMSNDIEFMYASVKCLICTLKSNREIDKEMDRVHGYQLLAMLFKRKKNLINSHILNLTFSLAISDDVKQNSFISNQKAFEHLLCDLDIWYECPSDIIRCLHDKLNELLIDNLKLFQRVKMLKKILFAILKESNENVLKYALSTIKLLIIEGLNSEDLVTYGHFLAFLIPESEEKTINYTIQLRDSLLGIIDDLISQNTTTKSYNFQEEFFKSLGFDWLILFMSPNCYKNTVIKSTKILFTLLLNHQNLSRFVSTSQNGGWLLNISNDGQVTEVNMDAQATPGFQILQVLFAKQPELVELYHLLFALLFDAQKIKSLNENTKSLDLNTICNFVFDKGFDSEQSLFCKINPELALDVILILFQMIRTLMNSFKYEAKVKDYAIILLQIFRFMYHNCDDFSQLSHNQDFLIGLISTLYPLDEMTPDELVLPSPVEIQPFAEAICDKTKNYKSHLSTHPARKLVLDFLRDLTCDSLMNKSNLTLIDIVLISVPDQQVKRNQEFLTELLKTILDHLLSTDIFSETLNQSVPSQNQLVNLFNLIDRIIDKLYEGLYRRDPRELFENLIKLQINLKKKLNFNQDQLINSINRIILYQLSRPCFNLTEQVNILDVLHKIQNNKNLIFSHSLNSDFYSCLTYCLLLITNDGEDTEARALVNNAAQRVWLDLFLSKKSQLEESLKINLSCKSASLDELRFVLEEPCSRIWLNFLDKKTPEKIQNQIQAKLSRVTGGISSLTRVVSLKKPKKEINRLNLKELEEATCQIGLNLKAMKEYMDSEIKKFTRLNDQKDGYSHEEWLRIERDLLRERALWGENTKNKLNKYKLDFTEGPNRQRKKLINNTDEFFKNYPYRIELENLKPNRKYKIPQSIDSKQYYLSFRAKSLLNFKQNFNDYLNIKLEIQTYKNGMSQSIDQSTIDEPNSSGVTLDLLKKSLKEDNLFEDNEDSNQNLSNPPTNYNASISRLLEDGEKINHIYRCARVTGLDTTEGLFLFGKEHFYVLDGYTLISTKDIVDIDSLKNTTYEPLIPKCSTSSSSTSSCSTFPSTTEKTCSKFAYEDIREVHNRRYLLQEIAMEIFSNDGRNFLLVFPRKCRQKIYDRLIALTPDFDSASQSIAGQRRSVNIEQNTGLFNALIGEKSVVQRWERGEITNFQYLMFLNTLAGRSYNDLMQYPVFPWILSDYDSDELDLNYQGTFRDLSKPMGAQTPERLKQFEKRFVEWEDPSGETPPYHYGTHYSSAMIVASYLVRMEPFTQIFLRLQGGHFDLADRMFHSIKDAWLSASKNNMADVKELIPEFFYLPEFLSNSNKFDLGKKQSGVELNDIVLPPWAKNDPREFVRVHRMALESDYVSAHLNEWIDLIFGYKQQGQAAIESNNVFHHLFYEGAVNIDEIDDPLRRNAIIGFINNFGQIPKQLFKKPHPVKKLNTQLIYGLIGTSLGTTMGSLASNLSSSTEPTQVPIQEKSHPVFIHYLKSLKPSLQPVKELKSPIGQIVCMDKGLLVVEQNKYLIPPSYQRYIAWGYTDESIRLGYVDYEKSYITFESTQDGAVFCCCSPDSKIIITAGQSTVINVWEMSKIKTKKLILKTRLYGHMDTVTCMAVSNNYHMLVTGSRDQSCIIWDINRWSFVRQLPNHYGAVSSICINELTGDIATASGTYLYLWSINGDLLASVNTITSNRNHVVLCVHMSQVNEWDNNNVILTGGTDGVVRMWSLGYSQVSEEEETTFEQNEEKIIFKAQSTLDYSSMTPSSGQETSIQTSKNSEAKFFPENFDPSKSESPENQKSEENKIIFSIEDKQSDLDDDFVLIDSKELTDRSENSLRPGHKWKRELIFRSKLTMHTSYDRKDNNEPASVTSVAISKDNKTIYVGDSRGRVYSWTCIENPGRSRADHWIRDDVVEQCKLCHIKFSFSERKHHCRDCGGVFCSNCTKYEIDLPRLNINKPVRVCQTCFNSNVKTEFSATLTGK